MELKMGRKRIFDSLVLSMIVLAVLMTSSCSTGAAEPKSIKLAGAGDLFFLSVALDSYAKENKKAPAVEMSVSSDSIKELKRGKYEAVLSGREPTSEELKGVEDYVIAYDAVCVIIDENSYVGGKYAASRLTPTRKTSGLREVSSEDVEGIISSTPETGWSWEGDYYSRDPGLDPRSWLYSTEYAWNKEPKLIINRFIFPAGKFDTQSVLFGSLGLDEKDIISQIQTFPINPKLQLEEEALSYAYNGNMYYSVKYGPQDYPFNLGFASRRVMTIAPRHVPVRVVSVDGVNPMENPQSIYQGTYRFSRKIHLLIPENSSSQANRLVDYLLSQEGQQLISSAGYLPILPE